MTTLVTGGAGAIGRGIAAAFADRGEHVVVADLDLAAAEAVAADLAHASAVALDVRDIAAWREVVDAVEGDHGPITTLVNNAGVPAVGPSHELPYDTWRLVHDVNVMGVVNGVATVYPRLVERGAGRIVNVASLSAFTPVPMAVAYAASKHAVLGLSRSLRAEARQHGVQVHVLCPGFVDTPLLHDDEAGGQGLSFATIAQELKMPVTTVERVVTDLMKGLDRERGVIVTPATAKATRWLAGVLPGVSDRVTRALAPRIGR